MASSSFASLLPLLLLWGSYGSQAFMLAKCSACKAVASTLQKRMENEKPRNHVDLRHRLDSSGKRYGKVIEYKYVLSSACCRRPVAVSLST